MHAWHSVVVRMHIQKRVQLRWAFRKCRASMQLSGKPCTYYSRKTLSAGFTTVGHRKHRGNLWGGLGWVGTFLTLTRKDSSVGLQRGGKLAPRPHGTRSHDLHSIVELQPLTCSCNVNARIHRIRVCDIHVNVTAPWAQLYIHNHVSYVALGCSPALVSLILLTTASSVIRKHIH